MLGLKRLTVAQYERALVFSERSLERALAVGSETLEKVTGKIDKLTVFGGLEGVMKDLVRIAP